MKVTAEAVEALTIAIFSKLFDEPCPTPELHRVMWDMCCSDARYVAIAAPRSHAKSTAITYCYVLACIVLREFDYIVIVSNTEGQSQGFVELIAKAVKELPELAQFGVHPKLVVDNKSEIVGRFKDGHKFCVRARGLGQQIRGRLFEGRRPNLIIGDDMEDKEEVESPEVLAATKKKVASDYMPALEPKKA